jgi:hypothetical protein
LRNKDVKIALKKVMMRVHSRFISWVEIK